MEKHIIAFNLGSCASSLLRCHQMSPELPPQKMVLFFLSFQSTFKGKTSASIAQTVVCPSTFSFYGDHSSALVQHCKTLLWLWCYLVCTSLCPVWQMLHNLPYSVATKWWLLHFRYSVTSVTCVLTFVRILCDNISSLYTLVCLQTKVLCNESPFSYQQRNYHGVIVNRPICRSFLNSTFSNFVSHWIFWPFFVIVCF